MDCSCIHRARTSGPYWFVLPFLLAVTAGCGSVDEVPVDPTVDYGDEPAYEPTGEPELDIGFYVEQLYKPLGDGGDVPVIHGLQGGTWTMPALRVKGTALQVELTVSLLAQDGSVIGAVSAEQNLFLASDGWLEVQALPIPVRVSSLAAAEVEDLYGQPAVLSVKVEDAEGRGEELRRDVVLVEG